jgi:hypothetical protein
MVGIRGVSSPENLMADPNDVRSLLANMLSAIQDSNEQMQALQNKVAASNSELQESVRAAIKSETEKLIKRFELENERLNKEFSERLHSEVMKCTHLIGQVQKDTEAELVAVKKNIQAASAGLEDRMDQHSSQTNSILDELTSRVIVNRSEVDTNVNKLEKRVASLDREIGQVKDAIRENNDDMKKQQKENVELITQRANKEKLENESQFARLHSEIKALKSRVSEKERVVRTADSAESCEAGNPVPLSPTAVGMVDNVNSVEQVSVNTSCACMSSSCKVCEKNGVNASNVAVTEGHSSASSYLSNSDFPLPLFDESSDVNPVFHLRQLDEFMKLKGIPKACQLAVAYRSLAGSLSRQWAETVSHQLSDYESFRQAFMDTWWSPSQQSLVRCSLYQGKYNRQSNLSLSAYFLKYTTMATYLDPRPTDAEIIEAIRYHFPISIQRAMLSTQLRSMGEALDLLKRIEVMERQENFNKYQNPTASHGHNPNRPGPALPISDRNRGQGQVRHIQYHRAHSRNRYNGQRNFYNREQGNEPRTGGSQNLDPQATSFNPSSENRRVDSPRVISSTNPLN